MLDLKHKPKKFKGIGKLKLDTDKMSFKKPSENKEFSHLLHKKKKG